MAIGTGMRRSIGTLIAAALVLVLILTLEASPAAGASRKACRVTNTDTGQDYTRLQQAVSAATQGDRLVVKGTCFGETVIRKDLVVVGVETRRLGRPTLLGSRSACWPGTPGCRRTANGTRLLTVRARVKLRDLEIKRGWARWGAGIRNLGNLTLADVTVRGCWTSTQLYGDGGGIYNLGRLVLNGRTRVANNYSGGAGGIANEGTLILNGSSLIVGNDSYFGDAGIHNAREATLILNGSSMIRGGLSAYGVGGVGNFGTLTMNDASVIRHNSTWEDEGVEAGVYNGRKATATMNDASSISGHREGAVENDGKFTMNGTSSISGNRYFGAVNNDGAFTMNDTSSISGNTGGCYGAGVSNWGRLTMTGTSSITGNTVIESYWGCDASLRGGGVYHASGKLVGVTCGPDGKVHGNSPDDCFIE